MNSLKGQKCSSLAKLFQKLQLQFTHISPGRAWASYEKENLTNNLQRELLNKNKKKTSPHSASANPNEQEYY